MVWYEAMASSVVWTVPLWIASVRRWRQKIDSVAPAIRMQVFVTAVEVAKPHQKPLWTAPRFLASRIHH